MKKFAEIFKNKNYNRLFFAHLTSQMGSTIGLTAFMFYLLNRFSNQPAYASITELMYSLPTLAVFLFVGVFADRMDRQKIAYYCDWICVGLSLALIGTIILGWMPLIFAVLFLRSAVQKFFYPSEQGLIQGILNKEDYTTAAGLNQLVMSLFMLFGNGLGILAFWTIGIYGAILVDVLSFIISAFLIKSCKIKESVRLPNGTHKLKDLKIKFVLKDFKAGFVYIIKHKLLLSLIGGFFVFGIVNGGFSVMPVFILKYKLAPDTYEELSIVIGIVFGVGVLIGSVIASALVKKYKLYQLTIAGLIISGGFIILASLPNNTVMFMSLIFISALGLPIVNIAIGGWMPEIIDPKMMGRVQGWVSPLTMFSHSLTLMFIAYSFPAILSVEMLFWLVGGCLVFVALFYSVVLPKFAGHSEINSTKDSSVQEVGSL